MYHSPTIDVPNSQDFSIAFWIKSYSGNSDAIPLSKNVYGSWSGYMFLVNSTNPGYCNTTGQCSFYVAASSAGDACANNPISNDSTNWYFLTGIYDATLNKTYMYVNSVLQNDVGSKTGTSSNTKQLSFGAYNDSPTIGFFKGKLDNIRFYNRLLTQPEIDALYNEVNPILGVKEFNPSNNDFSLYPNPSKNKISVKTNGNKQPLNIYNSFGSLVYNAVIGTEVMDIDLSSQSSGIYFVRIGTITKKIIKE